MKLGQRISLCVVAVMLVAAGMSAGIRKGDRSGDDNKEKKDTVKAEVRAPEHSIVDEVIWVVGDEPILKSDVETMRLQGDMEGYSFPVIQTVRSLSNWLCRSFSCIRQRLTVWR